MKANLRPQLWQSVRKKVLQLSGKPIMEYVGHGAAAMALGFLLSGFR